jgi:hypothetical protein
MKFLFAAMFAILLATGCATQTVQSRIHEKNAEYSALPPELKSAVDQGRVIAGMSMDAVYMAWGKPSQVLSGGNQMGETVTWLYEASYLSETTWFGAAHIYHTYTPGGYVRAQAVFVNGNVAQWQTFPAPTN